MGKAKDIVLRPIDSKTANALIRRVHYSGKVVQNSQLHIGVYYHGKLEGAMQFGPSLDKRKLMGLVEGTKWNEFIELNRLAFTDALPRNSESRALAVAMRLLKKHAPQIKWVVTFADGTQCGDGTIYRAAGFVLTGIKPNVDMCLLPDGKPLSKMSLSAHYKTRHGGNTDIGTSNGASGGTKIMDSLGGVLLNGFQLRYIYFPDPSYRDRLTVPEIPYSRIWEMGAGMYRGEKVEAQRAGD